MIAVTPLRKMLKLSQSTKVFSRDFLLIWDWEELPGELQDLREHETLLQTNTLASEHSKIECEGYLEKATRTWNVTMILYDSEESKKAQKKIQEAIKSYEIAAREEHEAIVKQLLEAGEVDLKDKDGTTPLWWAAKGGHDTMVKLLLGTGKVDIDLKGKDGTTPLRAAAGGGHLDVVERLLQEKANVNVAAAAEYNNGRTALQAAAEGGHLDVMVRQLQEKADVNAAAAEYNGRTALQAAAEGGHLAVEECLRNAGAIR
jgi:ankyrin repeat protein